MGVYIMVILGIDLGTSNSLASYREDGQTKIIDHVGGSKLLPSIVGIDEDQGLLVGELAKERRILYPEKTFSVFKRFLGSKKQYIYKDQLFTPVELSSFVLKELKSRTEEILSQVCTKAVISIPAYFNNIQRKETIQAAKLAGFEEIFLISEPTAAALGYGITLEEDRIIIVLDLGGGTFDVSLLDIFEGVVQVNAIAGDNHLGGEDFTRALINDFLKKNELSEAALNAKDKDQLYREMNQLKENMADNPVSNRNVSLSIGKYEYTIHEEEYEQLVQPLLDRIKNAVLKALRDSQVSVDEIDDVVLVGGATRDEVIRKYVSKLFNRIPYNNIQPDEAVCRGASIFAAMQADDIQASELILTDVIGYTLGTEISKEDRFGTRQDMFHPIIERNTTIPVSKEHIFSTISDNQREVLFEIYQGESSNVENNLFLGSVSINIPPAPKNYLVACRFTYDINGILEVIVTDKKTGVENRLIIENDPGSLSKEEIKESLKKLSNLKTLPVERTENQVLLAKLDRLYSQYLGRTRFEIAEIIESFRAVLDYQDEKEIRKMKKSITAYIDRFEGEGIN